MKNKLLFLISAVLASFFFCFGCAKREIANSHSKGKNIICFGDSITFGYGVLPVENYPTALSKILGKNVINAGIDGDTSGEALKRLKSDVLERDPYLVIVEFGGNDFLRKTPVEDTVSNIRKMVADIQAHGAMVAVVDISAGLFLAEYGSAYKKLAKDTKSIFVPHVLTGIITNPSMKSDFLHPNQDGYQIIAQRVYKEIVPYIAGTASTTASQ